MSNNTFSTSGQLRTFTVQDFNASETPIDFSTVTSVTLVDGGKLLLTLNGGEEVVIDGFLASSFAISSDTALDLSGLNINSLQDIYDAYAANGYDLSVPGQHQGEDVVTLKMPEAGQEETITLEQGQGHAIGFGQDDVTSIEETSTDITFTFENASTLTVIYSGGGDTTLAANNLSDLASQLAEVEPAAGEEGASGQNTGLGFNSDFASSPFLSQAAIGPINPTALNYRTIEFDPERVGDNAPTPAPAAADVAPTLDSADVCVLEDGSVQLVLEASPNNGGLEFLTITIEGIDAGWDVDTSTSGGTYDPVTGTWTLVLPSGESFTGGPTFTPPAESDIDLTGLVITATGTDPSSGDTISSDVTVDILVDAVADAPEIKGGDTSGNENTAVDIKIGGSLGSDQDGSETITGYEISGVPDGFNFNQGTNLGGGVWSFTPDQINGLQITAPTDYDGALDLTATVFNTENPASDDEKDLTNNDNSASTDITVTFTPTIDPPDININNGADDICVLEDGSVDVPLTVNLSAGAEDGEFLTVTVTGIDASWGFSSTIGTYDAATGTWTVTLPANTNLDTVFTFDPPAESDIDLNDITVTATVTDPDEGTSATSSDDFDIVVDAVADAPEITASDEIAEEGAVVSIHISGSLGSDQDGSESITGYQISGVPTGFTFSVDGLPVGTLTDDGDWNFTPDEIIGLQITGPADFDGTLNLTATVFNSEHPAEGGDADGGGGVDQEKDFTNNDNSASTDMTITFAPTIDPPDININNGVDDICVLEDGSVDVPVTVNLSAGAEDGEFLTVTVTGIDASWGFSSTIGTYDAATGTWTVTLPANTNLDTVFTFDPPAESDIDLNDITVTATVTDPDEGTSATSNDDFDITVDAVADAPELTVSDEIAEEGAVVSIHISGSLGSDQDGSESITGYEISGVPTGFSFNVGTDLGGGVWSFTPDEIIGRLEITSSDGFDGALDLTVTVFSTDNPTDGEWDLTNNTNSTSTVLTITWVDDQPIIVPPAEQNIDETNLDDPDDLTVEGTIDVDFGEDAPGTFDGNDTFSFDGSATNGQLTSGGSPITVTQTAGGYAGTDADGNVVFTLDIDPATGDYTFTLLGTLDHADGTDHDDIISLDFGFTVTDSDGDTASNTITINVADDGPSIPIQISTAGLAVDETNLDNGSVAVNGDITIDYGADGAGTFDGNDTFSFDGSATNGQLTSGGSPVTVTQTADGYVGTDADGNIVFTMDFTSTAPPGQAFDPDTGYYTFTLIGTLDHADGTNPNDSISLDFGFAVTDSDGDTVNGTITVFVADDGPSIGPTAFIASFYESELANGPFVADGTLDIDFGADGAGEVAGNGDFQAIFSMGDQSQPLTSGGLAVTVTQTENGYVGTDSNGNITFSLTIDPLTGDNTFTLFGPLDHPNTEPNPDNPHDIIWLKFGVDVTDADGDTVTSYIQVDVADSVPTAHDDINKFDAETTLITDGNVITGENGAGGNANGADTLSQDADTTVTEVTFNGTAIAVDPITGATIDGDYGTLTINPDGSYTYELFTPLPTNLDNVEDSFSYTITDGDGDTSTATLDIIVAIPDDQPIIVPPAEQSIDETDLPVGITREDLSVEGGIKVDFGDDGPGTFDGNGVFSFDGSATNGQLTSGGLPITVTQTENGYVGTDAKGNVTFTLDIDPATGDYTFTLLGTLDHADGTDPNDSISLDFGFTVTDNDGDTASNVITINVADDGPSIGPTAFIASFYESELANGPFVADGTLDIDFGADGAGEVAGNGDFQAIFSMGDQSQPLTSGGLAVTVTQTENGYVGTDSNGNITFSLTIDPLTGDNTFTLFGPLDHPNTEPNPDNPHDIIWLKFGVDVTDADGDTVTSYIQVDVADSWVVARDDTNGFDAATTLTTDGNVITGENGGAGAADHLSQDADTTVIEVTFNGTAIAVDPITGATIDGDYGTLTIYLDGSYTYDLFTPLPKNVDNVEDSFSYTITDGDGDTSTATLDIVADLPDAAAPILTTEQGADADILDPNDLEEVDAVLSLPPVSSDDIVFGDIVDTNVLAEAHSPKVNEGSGWTDFAKPTEDGISVEGIQIVDWINLDDINTDLDNGRTETVNSDTADITAVDGNSVTVIEGFDAAEGDVLDFSSVLLGFDPLTDALSDFVKTHEEDGKTVIQINPDGAVNADGVGNFETVAILQDGGINDLETALVDGSLIVN